MTAHRRAPADLHVLLTSDTVGGVFSYASGLAVALCAEGVRVSLVLQGPPARADQIAALQATRHLDVIVTDLALEWLDPDGADFSRARLEFESIARRVRPDVVHLNGYREALTAFSAPKLVVAHSCVGTWWRACRGGMPDAAWDRYSANVRAGLDAANAWAAPSRDFRDAVAALYAPRTRGHVVYNGIAPRSPGTSDRPVVLAAGRMWDEAKDLLTTARAAARTIWPVEIAGPLRRDGDTAAMDGGAARCLGELPQAALHRAMGAAAIFASAAVYEPFGLAVLEAAASGCALVLSDIESFREIWGDAALFFAPRDADDLARQINRLATDDALRSQMRARSLSRAQRLTVAKTAARTRDFYEDILIPHNATAIVASLAGASA